MVNFNDSVLEEKRISNFFIFPTLIGMPILIWAAFTVLLSTSDKLFFLILAFFFIPIIILGTLNIYFYFLEGRKFIFNLQVEEKGIKIFTISGSEKSICKNDIDSILYKKHKPLIAWLSSFMNSNNLSLTLYLKDGRFFRISPHMERLEELKELLERIIEENKQRGLDEPTTS